MSGQVPERTATEGTEMQDIRYGKVGTTWTPAFRMGKATSAGTTRPSVTVTPADATAIKATFALALVYVFLLAPMASVVTSLFVTPLGRAVASLACHWSFVPLVIWVANKVRLGDSIALCKPTANGYSLVMMVVLASLALRPIPQLLATPSSLPLGGQAYMVAFMCFVGTVEELLFRGVVKDSLARIMPAWKATVASSAIFALSHIPVCLTTDPMGLVSTVSFAFVFGIVTCIAKDTCGSNVPGIACHCVYDALFSLIG